LNSYFGNVFGNIFGLWFYAVAGLSAVAGVFIGKKFNRRFFLIFWVLLGVGSTLSLLFFSGYIFSLIISVFFGLSLGLGLPGSLACMADSTGVGERGRVSGAIVLASFMMAFLTPILVRALSLGITAAILLTAAVRSTSLVGLIFDSCEKTHEDLRVVYGASKNFLFYLFPWVVFVITAGAVFYIIPTSPEYDQAVQIGSLLRFGCIAVSGFVTGVVADRFGRKQPLIIGLVMFYTGFTLVAFEMNPTTAMIFYLATGVAWGSLLVVFLSVPGDLSNSSSRAKYYAAGTMLPIIILLGLTSGPTPALLANLAKNSSLVALSFVLFLTILPILRAKETLPESSKQARKLKNHLNKIEKLMQDERKK
jgi:MFS family permease